MKFRLCKRGCGLFSILTAVVVAILICRGHAVADDKTTEAKSDPIRITADRLTTDNQSRTAVFSGHVTAEQNDTTLTADELKIFYASGDDAQEPARTNSIERLEAYGHVRIQFDNKLAVSNQAVYTIAKRQLSLEGPDTKVVSGADEISGYKITVDRNTGKMIMKGDEKNRVKAVIHSEQRGLN